MHYTRAIPKQTVLSGTTEIAAALRGGEMMIIWNENIELYEEEKAEFEIDEQDDDDFAISLPLFELNRIIFENKNYDTFEISSDESQEPL